MEYNDYNNRIGHHDIVRDMIVEDAPNLMCKITKVGAGIASVSAAMKVNVLLHELGHLVAIRSLFVDVNPYIEIAPRAGIAAWVQWGGPAKQLTDLGAFISEKLTDPDFFLLDESAIISKASGLVSLAGPLMEVVFCVTSIGLSHQLADRSPIFAAFNAISALYNAYDSLGYSKVTYKTPGTTSDYIMMERLLGIPQAYSIAAMTVLTGIAAINVGKMAIGWGRAMYNSWNNSE